MKAVFGYGSLILPTSLIGRFDPELREKRDELKRKDKNESFLPLYLEDNSVRKWEESRLNFVPAKVYGLERFYSVEYYEDGNMLAAEEAGEDKYINGVIIFPLEDRQFEKIAETEEGYRTITKKKSEIETYISEEKLKDRGIELPEEITVFVAEDTDIVNKGTDKRKLESYHKYIPNGVKLLAEKWFEEKEVAENFENTFMEEFNKTTFEINDEGTWERMSKK